MPLKKITSEMMIRINREHPSLRSLSLASNCILLIYTTLVITKIENLHYLTSLEKLNISKNQLSVIEGLNSLGKLRDIDLSKNSIEIIQGLDQLQMLKTLNLSGNKIADINEISKLKTNKNLKELFIKGNPLTEMR